MRKVIHTEHAPAAIGTYSQAIQVGDTVYLSGQVALDPKTMKLVEGGFEKQLDRVMKNLQAVCTAAGGVLDDMVKFNVYLLDLGHFETVNKIMASYLNAPYPARAAIEVVGLPKGSMVEIDGVMVVNSR